MSRPKTMDLVSGPVSWPMGLRGQEVVFQDLPSPVVACTAEEDKARQEYAVQSEIGYQISRFGVGHPVAFGEVDFDNLDLTRAMGLIEESQQAWLRLPRVVRDRYASWVNVEKAAQSGELEQLLKASGIDGGVLPSKPGASASESAADA